jgi:Lytic transglycolase
MLTLRAVKFAAAIVLALGAAACSSNKDGMADAAGGAGGFGAGGAATPGSAQDFVVNVGDRVFFETDQTDLTPTAGTKIKVTNKQTGQSVVVRINDRGPYAKDRIIDLSEASAQAIGLSGVADVALVRL